MEKELFFLKWNSPLPFFSIYPTEEYLLGESLGLNLFSSSFFILRTPESFVNKASVWLMSSLVFFFKCCESNTLYEFTWEGKTVDFTTFSLSFLTYSC